MVIAKFNEVDLYKCGECDNSLFYKREDGNDYCLVECEDNYYISKTNQDAPDLCTPCDPTCATCNSSEPEKCTSCIPLSYKVFSSQYYSDYANTPEFNGTFSDFPTNFSCYSKCEDVKPNYIQIDDDYCAPSCNLKD